MNEDFGVPLLCRPFEQYGRNHPSLLQGPPTQIDGGKPYKYGSLRGEGPAGLTSRKACEKNLEERVQNRCVTSGTLPCANITSLNPDACMVTSVSFLHTEAGGQPSKKSKKGGSRGSLALLQENIQFGCVSHDGPQRKSVLRENGKVWIELHSQFLKEHEASRENTGKERSIAGNHSQVRTSGVKSVNSKIRGKIARRRPLNRSFAPSETHVVGEKKVFEYKREAKEKEAWVMLSEPHLTKYGKKIRCKTGNCVS